MQKIPLIISSIIALTLTIYIGVFELEYAREADSFSKFILAFEPEDLKEIEIKNKDLLTIVVNRDTKVWKISKPLPCRANQELIESIATQLPKLPKIYCLQKKDQKPLSEYALDKANLMITVTFRDPQKGKDKTRTLSFGKLSGTSNEVFAKADDDDNIYLLPASVYQVLSKDLNHFRNKKLLDQIPEKLVKISYETPDENWAISKTDFSWKISEPVSWMANQELVIELLKNITKLEVNRFVENDLSKKEYYGLNQPSSKIQIFDTDKNVTTIYLGAIRSGSAFVQNTNENFIYSVDVQELFKCIPKVQSLKDFSLFATKSPEIVQVEYNQENEKINFQKNIKQQWMVNNSTYPLDQQSVTFFVELVALSAPEYFIEGEYTKDEFGFNSSHAITVNVVNLKGQKETLKIGNAAKGWAIASQLKHFNSLEKAKKYAAHLKLKDEEIVEITGQYYALFNQFTQIFTIDEELVAKLKSPLIKFEPLEFPEIDINKIYTIDRIVDGQKEHYQRFGSNVNWEITSPEKASLKDKEIALFIFTLCYFKVEEWVKDKFTVNEFKEYGLDNPYIQIEATFSDLNDKVKTLQYKYLISKKIKGRYYGCIYVSANKLEYMLLPKLFIVPEKTINDRLLKKLY